MALIGEFGAATRDEDSNVEPDTFTFYGETFTVADRVGAMPLLRFAAIADAGTQAEELAGLAAMHELLRDCLAPGDWSRFQKVAADQKVEADELMEVCGTIYAAVTGRPTQRPSVSAAGSSETSASSREPSFSAASSPLGNVPPIQMDPRVRALQPVAEAGAALVG